MTTPNDQKPTPETDAAIRHEGGQRYIDRDHLVLEPVWDYVEPAFARDLERRLHAAEAEREEANAASNRDVESLIARCNEVDALKAERDTALARCAMLEVELQKVCDHEWQHIDDSFDHEFGTEQVHSCLCEKCGATKPYEPETFGDEVI